jgi:hypothetical protein
MTLVPMLGRRGFFTLAALVAANTAGVRTTAVASFDIKTVTTVPTP